MVKLKEDGTAPVSKYAAKKAARATKKEDAQSKVEETKVEESKVETKVEDTKPEVVQEAPAVVTTAAPAPSPKRTQVPRSLQSVTLLRVSAPMISAVL